MLDDITIIEIGTSTSSAYCGRLLADAGATVLRAAGPERPGRSAAYSAYLHRGKTEIRVREDLDLAQRADVLVHDGDSEDQRAQVAEVRALNPGVVVVSLSDYGLEGPDAATPASELTLQADAGIVTLHPTGDRPPVRCGADLAALTSACCAAMGAVMALISNEAGVPRLDVDVSRFEALTAILQYPWLFDQIPEHHSYPVPQNAIPGIERARDGWVCVVAITPQQWTSFKTLAGVPALEDPRFDFPSERIRLGDEITKHIREFTESRTVEELVRLGVQHRVPIVPVGTPETVAALPPYAAGGSFEQHPDGFIYPRAAFRVRTAPAQEQQRPTAQGDQPLAGLRVLEFATFQAGPLAAAHLAELGADVIKVESAKRPDLIRFTGSPMSISRFWERSASFAGVNLGKRAITVDVSTEAGLEIMRRLILQSDVMIENYSPRVLEQWGLGYEAVREIRPDIIMIRMPAWGLEGPWRDWPGFTYTANATSGLSSLTGYADGEPLLTGTVIDPIAGFLTAFVALSAIRRRRTSGAGCLIEVPLCDVAAQLTAKSVVEASSGEARTRSGNRTSGAAPAGVYRCADRSWLAISVDTERHWKALCRIDGLRLEDPRFADLEGRLRNHDELDQLLAGYCATRTSLDVLVSLRGRGIPAATVNRGSGAVDHPQLKARDRVHEITHAVFGTARYVGLPIRFSPTALTSALRPAPLLGQDNEAVLAELRYSREDIDKLFAEKVIASAPG